MLWVVLGSSLLGFAAFGAALGATMGLSGFIILQFFANGATHLGISAAWDLMNNFTFSAIPMFLLLGAVVAADEEGSGPHRLDPVANPLVEVVHHVGVLHDGPADQGRSHGRLEHRHA